MYFVWPKIRAITRRAGFELDHFGQYDLRAQAKSRRSTNRQTGHRRTSARTAKTASGGCCRLIEREIVVRAGKALPIRNVTPITSAMKTTM